MAPFTSRALRSTNWRIRDAASVDDEENAPLYSNHQDSRKINGYCQEEDTERVPSHDDELSPASRPLASSTRIYVGSLPYIAQRNDVASLCLNIGIEVVNIDMSVDRFTNRNPGYCFVDLTTPQEATRALELLPQATILGRPIRAKPCVQKQSDRTTATQLQITRWGSSTFSPVESDVESLLLPIRRRRRLLVSGMPKPANQHTSDVEIRELFKGFAVEAISKVKWPPENAHGLSKDLQYAFVDLESAEEAERAMLQLNGAQCWGGRVRIGIAQRTHDKILERVKWEEEHV